MLLTVLALGALAIPVLDMRLGLPDDATAAPDKTKRQAYDLLTDGFGPGFNGPLTVVVDTGDGERARPPPTTVAGELAALDGRRRRRRRRRSTAPATPRSSR